MGPEAVRGGFVPCGELTGDALDTPVRPLVAALNRLGWVRTVFSCAGHPEEPDSAGQGRRQAHVDVLVADPAAWRRLAADAGRAARAAVQRLGAPGVRLRVAEGALGEPPPWLAATLPDAKRWRYRRLVLEPVPYDLPPADCRRVLDTALAAATAAATAAVG